MTSSPQTLLDKIWDAHRTGIRDDGREIIYMDRNVVHDLHGSHAYAKLEQTHRTVRRPDLTFGVLDHSPATTPGRTDATNPKSLQFAQGMRAGAERYGFRLFDVGDPEQGIAHVIAPELGLVLPGSTYACPDSHACTVGGLGALAFACGTSELEHVLATQTVAMKKPKQMRIWLDGTLRDGVTAKDVILHLIGLIGVAGGRGFMVEYAGDVTRALSVEARFTLCNMTIEFGPRNSRRLQFADAASHLGHRPESGRRHRWRRSRSRHGRPGARARDRTRARLYGADAGNARCGPHRGSRVHRVVHECAHRGSRNRGCGRAGTPGRRARARHRRPRLVGREARGRKARSRSRVPRCGL
jgi:3-isopropylmalate/(R)-2-methylmalate dehydratase large subunit